MTEHPLRFDTESVRQSWDRAAGSFDRAVSSGVDYYRTEFFGPEQVALCGDVRVDRYFERTPIEYPWERFGESVTTTALHATLEDWFGWIHGAGFLLRGFYEPRPTTEALERVPDLEDSARVPYYVFFDLLTA